MRWQCEAGSGSAAESGGLAARGVDPKLQTPVSELVCFLPNCWEAAAVRYRGLGLLVTFSELLGTGASSPNFV